MIVGQNSDPRARVKSILASQEPTDSAKCRSSA